MAWSWIRPGDELLALSREPAYVPVIGKMRERVDYWKVHFEDSPDRKPGWGHNYVCPECSSQLVYDRDKPLEHRCGTCGHLAENTPLVLEAWTYSRRYDIATTLVDAAILYRMAGDASDYDFVVRVIDYYASHYVEFDEYGLYAGRGKVMGQSLCEAVWGDHLLKALIAMGFDGKSELGQRWHRQMFLPASRLVMAQSGLIHNIPLWHASFAVGAGLLFEDERLVQQSLNGALGARNQVLEGFTPDGIWYENSTTYHYYSLTAATNLCLFLRHAGREEPEIFARVMQAYTAFLKLRFANDIMPAFNDGWRAVGDGGLKGKVEVYLEAAHLFEGMPGAQDISDALAGLPAEGTLGMLLYGRSPAGESLPPKQTVHLAHNCLGVLRSPEMEVFFKYGNLHRSHAHPDALAICIPPFSYDMGTPGYSSPYHRGWYTTSLCHSAFVVDGLNQRTDARGTGSLCDNGIDMAIDDAYEGVTAQRSLRLEGARLTDCFIATCAAPRQVDWVFHGAGAFECDAELVPDTLPESGAGYDYLRAVQLAKGAFCARFTAQGQVLTLRIEAGMPGARIYVALSPDNPADQTRHTIIVRTQGEEARVNAVFEVAPAIR